MPQLTTTFTFNEDIKINEALVEKLKGLFDYDILEEYEYEEVCIEFLQEFLQDVKTLEGNYDEGIREKAVAWFVGEHMDDNSDICKIFNIKKINEKWDDEGSDRYYYYKFVSKKELIKDLKGELKETIGKLKNLDVEVIVNYK